MKTSTWSIVEPTFDINSAKAYEGLFTQGSGYMHIRGSLEEPLSGEPQNLPETGSVSKMKWGAYIPGLFCPTPNKGRTMCNLPYFLGLTPIVDGEALDMTASTTSEYRRELDLRTAVLTRQLVWQTRSGAALSLVFERFVSMARPQICIQRLSIKADKDTEMTIRAGIDTDVRTKGVDYFSSVSLDVTGPAALQASMRTGGDHDVKISTRMLTPETDPWTCESDERCASLLRTFSLAEGKTFTVEKRTAVWTSFDLEPADPEALLADTAELTFDQLLAENAERWKQRWQHSDVVIEGDERSQYACRVSIYHLLRAHVTGDSRVSIGAKAFAGDQYNGAFFWDTELYVLPFFIYTDQERARTLVDFRVQALPGAMENAAKMGYKGARYPWQSDDAGRECCPMWEYAQMQPHINADIVYAMAHFARATGQEDYLHGPAAKAIVETSRFWMDRVDYRPGDDYPSLLGVMGPDEYQILSNNNAYTNRLVSFALRLASEVGSDGGASPEECRKFLETAEKLPIPKRENGLVLQAEEFDRKAKASIEELHTNKELPFMWVVPLERIYRSQLCKQADVLLLMALFPAEFSDEEVRLAWDYYVPITTHESSLSSCIHALVALRLGMTEEAWAFWKKTSETDIDTSRKVTRGAAEGPHAACCGGNWMVAVFGFGGVSTAIASDVLTVQPHLPDSWTRLAFPLIWQGTPVTIEITPGQASITNHGSAEIPACIAGTDVTILPDATETRSVTS